MHRHIVPRSGNPAHLQVLNKVCQGGRALQHLLQRQHALALVSVYQLDCTAVPLQHQARAILFSGHDEPSPKWAAKEEVCKGATCGQQGLGSLVQEPVQERKAAASAGPH